MSMWMLSFIRFPVCHPGFEERRRGINVLQFHVSMCVSFGLQPPFSPPPKKAADGKKVIVVLDPKRSNAINIGLTVLPPPYIIKTAILNFDEFAITKEGIEVRAACQVCFFQAIRHVGLPRPP